MLKKLILTGIFSVGGFIGILAGDKPEFPGGQAALDKYLSSNVIYPEAALQNGVEGVVGVQFIVHTDGSIGAIKIVRMVDPDLEKEAIRVVKKMPNWIPADQNGTPIEASAQVNVPFKQQ